MVQDLLVSMSTQGALTSLPSSTSTHWWTYEIFLSFRGEDTRKSFTDHLYDAFERKGICTFRDDEKLERGNNISKELLKAIEKSRFAIVIFSENYASSKWCLDELVHIVKCKKETGLKVLPIFYHVNPSDVRKQRGTFAQAFEEHKKRFAQAFEEHKKRFGRSFLKRLKKCTSEKMKKWRSALREVANISGWNLHDRNESEFIREIVREVEKLSPKISSTTKNLVGIESSVQKLISLYVGFKSNVAMIGIYGIGGLGKTTLARLVYDNFHNYFEGSSFIANVREGSKNLCLHRLQQQLLADILKEKNIVINDVQGGAEMIEKRLCCKKVLLVIDDVDQLDQLENLARNHSWFGSGSCIIITTRDERVLIQHGVPEKYKPNELESDDASKLFCLTAFKKEQPEKGYMKLSQEVVKYANGLPLAIVTLGTFFVGRTIEEWQCALDGFKKTERKIFDVLKISYDGLGAQHLKDIFLDIACFFGGMEKDQVIEILENCGFNARYGISVLMEKSLLTMDDNKHLRMHDLLQEMGEQIIRQESGENLGKQSRLWLGNDLLDVLENNMATEAIQAIVLRGGKINFKFEELFEVLSSKMSNLRLMIIGKTNYWHHDQRYLVVPNDQRQLFVPNQLRHLSWSYCPLKCLSSSSQPKKLVRLDLYESRIEYLWEGVMCSVNLKFINLCRSKNLIRTPDFSGVPMLEGLDLFECDSLVEIHQSIGQLSRLSHLDLQYCVSLTYLPSMPAKMESTTDNLFSAQKTLLDLSYCKNLNCLPNISQFSKLETLDLGHCEKLQSMPELPSTVKYINAAECISLKPSPALRRQNPSSRPPSPESPVYDEGSGGVAFTILNHYLQGLLRQKTRYDTSTKKKEEFQIIIPSLRLPRWLTHQWMRNSSRIDLPPNWCNSRWMGFAFCAHFNASSFHWGTSDITARVIALGDSCHRHYASKIHFKIGHCKVRTDHIWLLYLSRDDWFATIGNDKCSQIEVVFETDSSDRSCLVLQCGASLVYRQDEGEFNQAIAQRNNGRIITYEGWDGVHHGFLTSTRSNDDYNNIFNFLM